MSRGAKRCVTPTGRPKITSAARSVEQSNKASVPTIARCQAQAGTFFKRDHQRGLLVGHWRNLFVERSHEQLVRYWQCDQQRQLHGEQWGHELRRLGGLRVERHDGGQRHPAGSRK